MITAAVVILRLMTGEDIVGMTAEDEKGYQVIAPFKLIYRRFSGKSVGVTVVPWIPNELLEENVVHFLHANVLCTMTLKREFVDYYHRISDATYMRSVEFDATYRAQIKNLYQGSSVTASDNEAEYMKLLSHMQRAAMTSFTLKHTKEEGDEFDDDDDFGAEEDTDNDTDNDDYPPTWN